MGATGTDCPSVSTPTPEQKPTEPQNSRLSLKVNWGSRFFKVHNKAHFTQGYEQSLSNQRDVPEIPHRGLSPQSVWYFQFLYILNQISTAQFTYTLPHILLQVFRKCFYIGSFEIRNETFPIKFDGQFRATRIL